MKKVLIICTVPTEKSGIPSVIFNLVETIDCQDLELGYVSINKPNQLFKDKLNDLGVKLYVLPRKLSRPISYIKQLTKVSKGYDVIHVHGNSATMVLEMIAARFAKIPKRIAHGHSTSCGFPLLNRICKPLFLRLCNQRVACGKAVGKWLYNEYSFEIINNGVDTSKYRFIKDSRDKLRADLEWDNNFIISNVANFLEVKNHKFLISTFSKVVKKHPEARLLLIGDGPLLEDTKQLVRNLNLNSVVRFTGSVTNVADYLSAIDLIVMPSLYEGLPLTLVEEQANGLCAVVSDVVTKDADITDNITFLPLQSGISVWGETISEFIENGVVRTEKFSDQCIGKIKDALFDIHDAAAKLKGLYSS